MKEDAMQLLRSGVLILAAMAVGAMAGVFQLYSHTIMPGLGRTDDRTFVGAFQAIDRAIINRAFMLTFFGALLFNAAAVVLNLGAERRSVLTWTVAALALYAVSFVVTVVVNVPLNDAIKAAGDPGRIADLAAVRARFNEARWVRWNTVRAVTTTASVACLAWALVLHGRTTPGAF
jgi:uncharacterized membrane protein